MPGTPRISSRERATPTLQAYNSLHVLHGDFLYMEAAMRRFGGILMILGANIIVGTIAAAFWVSALDCAVAMQGGSCRAVAIQLFFRKMTSVDGLGYWMAIVAGVLVFWRGKQIRAG